MANNKNQHFVPKAYLRRFGTNEGRSINLFALNNNQTVREASIKSQCSRHYFYGSEPVFENFVQYFEGRYGAIMQSLERGEVTTGQLSVLMQFLVLHLLRTPHMLAQRETMMDFLNQTEVGGKRVDESKEGFVFDAEREMQHQLYICAKETDILTDLAPVLLVNRTNVPFVTSDNPAFLLNKLYSLRYKDDTSGLVQSGLMACLPLNPGTFLFGYDAAVYQRIGRDNVHELRNPRDVDRLNEVQVQYATNTLYFQRWDDRAYVKSLASRQMHRRRDSWMFTWTGIHDGEEGEFERYRKLRPEDAGSTATRVTSASPVLPSPSTWPSFVNFKLRPRGWTTGSVVGFVRESMKRKAPEKGLREVVLPPTIPFSHTPQGREVIWQRKEQGQRGAAPLRMLPDISTFGQPS